MLITSRGNAETIEATVAAAESALLSFQMQMYDLEDLFANADQTEFLIVTVPTELAVRESVRLLNDLTFEAPDMPIKVRNVVANQVLSDGGDDVEAFLSRVESGQVQAFEPETQPCFMSVSDSPIVFAISTDDVVSYIRGRGSYATTEALRLDADSFDSIVSSLGQMLVDLATGVAMIRPECDSNNEAINDEPLPCLPLPLYEKLILSILLSK